jgi:hypothetical protein
MTAPAVATKSPSTFEDIVDVFYAPTAVFERRRNAGFGLAFLLYIVVSAVMFYAARPVLRPMFEQQMAKQVEKMQANPNLSPEQKEAMSARVRGMADSPLTLIGPMVAIPVTLFLVGLALWIAGKVVGSAASYGQAMMVTTFSFFPRLVLTALMTGYFIVTGKELSSQFGLGLSPAALLPEGTSSFAAAAASRFDLGVLWTTVLLGIGIAVVGRIPRAKGMIAAALVWLAGGLLLLGSAAMQG